MRYQQEYTLQEIGDELGYTREYIRQIEKTALDKLREDEGMIAVVEGAYKLPSANSNGQKTITTTETGMTPMDALHKLIAEAEEELRDNMKGIELLRERIAQAEADNEELEAGLRFLRKRQEKSNA